MTDRSMTDSGPGREFKVAEPNELLEGTSKIVTVAGRSIAVFRSKNHYYAIQNNCLHRGGPLGEGELNDDMVTCPWHGWKFNIVDGSFSMIPTLKVQAFRVVIRTDGVFIEL